MNEIEKLIVLIVGGGVVILSWLDPIFAMIVIFLCIAYLLNRRK